MTPEWRLVATLTALSAMGIAALITVLTINQEPPYKEGKALYYINKQR